MDTDEDPVLFKAQLFALTGVQHERQKVMVKGLTLKDNEWGNVKLKDVSHFPLLLPRNYDHYQNNHYSKKENLNSLKIS